MPSPEIEYLDFRDLASINEKAVALTSEEHLYDSDDEARLRKLLEEMKNSYNGEPDIGKRLILKASLLAFRVASLQSFHEGNKRTALAACDAFMRLNGLKVDIEDNNLLKALDKAAILTASLKEVQEAVSSAARK